MTSRNSDILRPWQGGGKLLSCVRYDVHLGGMTALAQQGHGQYLRLGGNAPVWVYGEAIPNWLPRLPLNASVETRNRSFFDDPQLGLSDESTDAGQTLPWDWQLKMSSPERAILEAMDELPDHESFHNLD